MVRATSHSAISGPPMCAIHVDQMTPAEKLAMRITGRKLGFSCCENLRKHRIFSELY